MSPEKIRQALALHYCHLKAEPRKDGWAFYLDPPQKKGVKSNRIIRASRSSSGAVTHLKLAVSSQHYAKKIELVFEGDEATLRTYIDRELHLFEKHFEAINGSISIRPGPFDQ